MQAAEVKFAKVNTPKSVAIIIFGLFFGLGSLYFIPDFHINSTYKMWAQIIASTITVVLLHAARMAMLERPEIEDEKLSQENIALKRLFKKSPYPVSTGASLIFIDQAASPLNSLTSPGNSNT